MTRFALGAVLGAILALTAPPLLSHDELEYDALIARLSAEEGFRPLPYRDTRGVLTVGYGRNLTVPFTRAESRYLLLSMLRRNANALAAKWRAFAGLPLAIRSAVLDMAYQLGPDGVLAFTDMRRHLEAGEYDAAADAALDSAWARETPARAKRVAEIFRSL